MFEVNVQPLSCSRGDYTNYSSVRNSVSHKGTFSHPKKMVHDSPCPYTHFSPSKGVPEPPKGWIPPRCFVVRLYSRLTKMVGPERKQPSLTNGFPVPATNSSNLSCFILHGDCAESW